MHCLTILFLFVNCCIFAQSNDVDGANQLVPYSHYIYEAREARYGDLQGTKVRSNLGDEKSSIDCLSQQVGMENRRQVGLLIDNKVNAVTGELSLVQCDLTVNGKEPLKIYRGYFSSLVDSSSHGWLPLNGHLVIFYHPDMQLIRIRDNFGSEVTYRVPMEKKNGEFYLEFVEEKNSGSPLHNDWKRSVVRLDKNKDILRIFFPNHEELHYVRPSSIPTPPVVPDTEPFTEQKNKENVPPLEPQVVKNYRSFDLDAEGAKKEWLNACFNGNDPREVLLLRKEKKSSGHQIIYFYDQFNRVCDIKSISFDGLKSYASAKIKYLGTPDETFDCDIETSDLQWVHYRGEMLKNGTYLLGQILRSNGKDEKFQYDKLDDNSLVLTYKILPDNRIYKFDYENNNGALKISKIGRTIYDTSPTTIYSFTYNEIKNEEQKGCSEIVDSCGNKTLYFFDALKKLVRIDYFSNKDGVLNLSRREAFVWSPKGELLIRALLDEQEKVISALCFVYDDKGRVIKERFCGNLSGEEECSIALNPKEGDLIGDYEVYETKKSYFVDEYDNYKSLTEDNGVQHLLSNVPSTALITADLLCYQGDIKERHFYEYDKNFILQSEIVDDGCTSDPQNLKNVTERKIKTFKIKKEIPLIGFTATLEESYLDLATNIPVLLKKENYFYSTEGNLVRKDVYDGNNNFCYFEKFKYDLAGNLIEESDPLGHKAYYTYDLNGNKIEEKNFAGQCLRYTYNFGNALIACDTISCEEGCKKSSFICDHKNRMVKSIDNFGNETYFTYDVLDRKILEKLPPYKGRDGELLQPEIFCDYDAQGTNKQGYNAQETSITQYNAYGAPVFITYPDGSKEHFVYNLDGTLKKHNDLKKVTANFEYDYKGRIVAKTIMKKKILKREKWQYSAFNLLSYIDGEGGKKTFSYDFAGRKILEIGPSGDSTQFVYNDRGGLLQEIKNDNDCTIFERDFLDRIIEERKEDKRGHLFFRKKFLYDDYGNLGAVTHFVGGREVEEKFVFDSFNRLVKHIDLLGCEQTFTYNENWQNALGQKVLQKIQKDGQGISVQNIGAQGTSAQGASAQGTSAESTYSCGIKTITTYDVAGRIATCETQSSAGDSLLQQEYFYNLQGKISLFAEKKKATRYDYDALMRPLSCTIKRGDIVLEQINYYYTSKGDIKEVLKGDGVTLKYSYDFLGNLADLHASDESIAYIFSYNKLNQLIEIKDLNNGTTAYNLDSAGKILSETLANGLTLQFNWDKEGRKTAIILPDNSRVDYNYDAHYLKYITRTDNSGRVLYRHSYKEYDLSGNILEEEALFPLGDVRYEIDNLGKPLAITSAFYQGKAIAFDSCGRVALWQQLLPKEATLEYAYNVFGTSVNLNEQILSDISNSKIGKDVPYQIDDLGHLVAYNGNIYKYDNCDRCISSTKEGTEEPTAYYKYDALNRLIEADFAEEKIQYSYDALNRCLSQKTSVLKSDLLHSWEKVSEKLFLYDNYDKIAVWENGQIVDFYALGYKNRTVGIEQNGKIFAPLYGYDGNIVHYEKMK